MHSYRLLRVAVMFVVAALLGVTLIVPAQRARADAGAPNWTAGDFWVYVDPNNPNNALRADVIGRENSHTLQGATYETFHLRQTTTSGSFSLSSDAWVRPADLGVVNTTVTVFNITTIITYDPPQTQASFPLFALKQWGPFPIAVSTKVGGFPISTATVTLNEQVDAELDVSVPAGRFHSFSIRTLGTGGYTKMYYSDQVGYWSKRETYNANNQKTGEMVLTQYRYAWGDYILWGIGAVIALVAVLVIAFLYKKRKQAMGRPGGVAGAPMRPPMQPPYGGQMPPQQPPQGP